MRLSDTPEHDHLLPNLFPARGRDKKRYPSVLIHERRARDTAAEMMIHCLRDYFFSVWGPKGQKGTILWLIIIFSSAFPSEQSLYGLYAT